MSSAIETFKEYDLYPSLFERIDEAFKELHFKKVGKKWESRYHLDGTKDEQGKAITYVYDDRKFMAKDNAKDENKGLIDLYMSLNNKDFFTALKELAKICNLEVPNSDSEEYKEYEQRQRNREHAKDTFVAALWGSSPEAQRVRDYLHSRKWTDEEIRKAELGLITSEIRSSLPDGDSYKGVVKDAQDRVVGGVGTTHLLTIPYRNGSRLFGFKFREVVEKSTGTKYLNTYGLQKSNGLFGIGIGVKDVVIVEGELDALHAQVRGAKNVTATTGGKATATQIQDAIRRGVGKFTLLFDNDSKGRSFIIPTIEAIQQTGKSIFVALLPDGCKDTDEYLAGHTIEEFNALVGEALPYAQYILYSIVEKCKEKEEREGIFTAKDREDFFSEVERLLNSPYIKPYEREDVFRLLETYEEALNFKVADFREWANRAYFRAQERNRTEVVSKASTEIQEALQGGRTDEALKLMRETASTLSARERATEYAKVFSSSTPQDYANYLSEIKEGIPTGYKFEQRGKSEPLTLNSGLTFVCGYRGHGKTSFLNNIALNETGRNLRLRNGKSVLYFSYEVDKRRLMLDLLNTFVNDPDISGNPLNSILHYFNKRGSYQMFLDHRTGGRKRKDGETTISHFETCKEEFFKDYLGSGSLTIVEENYKVEQLLDAIKYYLSTREVSLVCIDYAQLIYSEDYSRQRTEEIKKVVNDIKDFANREGLPFVLAAQFNREVDSPVSVDTKNIGEGGDFERIADTCIGLFNLKELQTLPKAKEEERSAKKLLEELGAASYKQGEDLKPIQGKLFVRLMKRRYGYYPLDTILEWEGRTKYIKPNDPEALKGEPQQGDLFTSQEKEEGEDLPF